MNNWVDLAIIAVYLIAVTLFGCSFYLRKGGRDANAFMAGGGKIPAWTIGLSIFATHVSSISFLALPAKAFSGNWNPYVLSLSVPIAGLVAAKYFVPFYRKTGFVSAYSFLENRFGTWARVYTSVCFLVMQNARSGMILFLLALLLQATLGIPCLVMILVTGVLTMVYSMMGGISAVIWTDAVQSMVLIGGTVFCLVSLGMALPEGAMAGISQAFDAGKFSLGSLSCTDWSSETFWVTAIYGMFINLQNFGIDQSFTQRYIVAKSDREAVRSTLFGASLYVPVTLFFVLIGTGLWLFHQANPGMIPQETLASPDSVFPWYIVHRLPRGISGLLVAAIISAAMSTISTTLNSGSTVLLEDYYKRFWNSHPTERQSLWFLRLTTAGLALFSIGVAVAVMKVTSALDAWWAMQSVLSGGMLGLFLLGMISKRTRALHAVVATVLGVLVLAWITFGPTWFSFPRLLHVNLAIVFGTMAIFLTGTLLPRFLGGKAE